jgi:hypothetical protein
MRKRILGDVGLGKRAAVLLVGELQRFDDLVGERALLVRARRAHVLGELARFLLDLVALRRREVALADQDVGDQLGSEEHRRSSVNDAARRGDGARR